MFYKTQGNEHPKQFIGHCCMIKKKREAAQELEKKEIEMATTLPVATTLGGCFCLPEFRLLIPTCTESMDVMGLGAETHLDAAWHFVVDERQAAELEEANVSPLTVRPINWSVQRERISVAWPHSKPNGKQKFVTLSIVIYYVPKDDDDKTTVTQKRLKGSNHLSVDDAQKYYLFAREEYNKKHDCDLSLIIGYKKGESVGSLLLMRFHSCSALRMPCLTDDERQKFLAAIRKKVGVNGLERMRRGGSSGLMEYSSNLMRLLSTKNSCPRKAKSALWLRDRNNLQLHLFYFGKRNPGKVVKWQYTTPQMGGQFELDTMILDRTQFRFLQDFIATKPLSAQIISKIEDSSMLLCGLDSICPDAVANELQHIQIAQKYIQAHCQDESRRKLLFFSFYASECTHFTLVCHPVGRHVDVFKNNEASLENRICFSFNGGESFGYGRGGKGRNKFLFGLCGW